MPQFTAFEAGPFVKCYLRLVAVILGVLVAAAVGTQRLPAVGLWSSSASFLLPILLEAVSVWSIPAHFLHYRADHVLELVLSHLVQHVQGVHGLELASVVENFIGRRPDVVAEC